MLVQFSMSNILSFKDEVTFSMVAAPIREKNDRLKNNVFKMDNKSSLLKTAAIYGANASGKSNVIHALNYLLINIFQTIKSSNIKEMTLIPHFALDVNFQEKPTKFEIIINFQNILYNYGFKFNNFEILEEHLTIKKERETTVFTRNKSEFKITNKYAKMLELVKKKMVPKNSLFITLAAQFNEDIARSFLSGLMFIDILSSLNDEDYKYYSLIFSNKSPINKNNILTFVQNADSSIVDFFNDTNNNVFFRRNLYNNHNIIPNKFIDMDSKGYESEGTKKILNISGRIFNCINNGGTLFIDELDTKLHPLLVEKIIELFNNPEANPNNAQLIFTTHNTSLLSAKLFRRDQIWLTEKNEYGVSVLFSLSDFKEGNKSIRNDESIEKNYLTGKYGGIPFLGDFDNFRINKE